MTIANDQPAMREASGPMLRVSLLSELLRSWPGLLVWVFVLAQAAIWVLVPASTYGAPPGDTALILAVGHQWRLGSPYGPPLADWLAELAFDFAGHHAVGLYLLSQVCVVVTFWAVFALGRAIVGVHHAAMAVLLMLGIVAYSVPAVEFGPEILAAPLTALALLHYWRAVGEGRSRYWLALGIDLGLLLLTTYAGLILLLLIALFTLATERGRAETAMLEPWLGGIILVVVVFPHLVWIDRGGFASTFSFAAIAAALLHPGRMAEWFTVAGWVLAAHAGLVILVIVASGSFADRRPRVPAFTRGPIDPLAREFVFFFALLPAFVATVLAALGAETGPVGGVASIAVLSGLAVIVLAGEVIRLYRERTLGLALAAILILPPLAIIGSIVVAAWIFGIGLDVDRPADDMGQFFTETFERRTARPLALVVGDPRNASLIAMASPDRPSLYLAETPELSPWASDADVREKGAVVVWPLTDSAGTPPAWIKARFPDLVAELPRSFERPIQGRLPLYRVGWGIIRPRGELTPGAPAAH